MSKTLWYPALDGPDEIFEEIANALGWTVDFGNERDDLAGIDAALSSWLIPGMHVFDMLHPSDLDISEYSDEEYQEEAFARALIRADGMRFEPLLRERLGVSELELLGEEKDQFTGQFSAVTDGKSSRSLFLPPEWTASLSEWNLSASPEVILVPDRTKNTVCVVPWAPLSRIANDPPDVTVEACDLRTSWYFANIRTIRELHFPSGSTASIVSKADGSVSLIEHAGFSVLKDPAFTSTVNLVGRGPFFTIQAGPSLPLSRLAYADLVIASIDGLTDSEDSEWTHPDPFLTLFEVRVLQQEISGLRSEVEVVSGLFANLAADLLARLDRLQGELVRGAVRRAVFFVLASIWTVTLSVTANTIYEALRARIFSLLRLIAGL